MLENLSMTGESSCVWGHRITQMLANALRWITKMNTNRSLSVVKQWKSVAFYQTWKVQVILLGYLKYQLFHITPFLIKIINHSVPKQQFIMNIMIYVLLTVKDNVSLYCKRNTISYKVIDPFLWQARKKKNIPYGWCDSNDFAAIPVWRWNIHYPFHRAVFFLNTKSFHLTKHLHDRGCHFKIKAPYSSTAPYWPPTGWKCAVHVVMSKVAFIEGAPPAVTLPLFDEMT